MRAVNAIGATAELTCVNHWPTAVSTHTANHPQARHFCQDVSTAKPEHVVPEGRLDLLLASPECVYFSRARGGKPVNDQRRTGAWWLLEWLTKLDVRCLLVENVEEFTDWGPVGTNGKPIPTQKGQYFQAWIQALWGLGYVVDWRVLNAADFGDATTRRRLFVQARKDGRAIRWPDPTHSKSGAVDMFGGLARWRSAREIIDWSDLGPSMLTRKRGPLSLKTRLRIARGLQRYAGVLAPLYIRLLDLPTDEAERFGVHGDGLPEPFVAVNTENAVPKSVDEPLGTITTIPGIYFATPTVEPFTFGNRNNAVPRDAGQPIPTLTTATGGGVYLAAPTAEPFVIGQQSESVARPVTQPIPTISTAGVIRLTTPLVVPYYGTGVAADADQPLATITTVDRFGLVSPLVTPYGPRAEARPVDEPLPTVMTRDRLGLAILTASFIVPQFGEAANQLPRVHGVEAPLPAVTGHGAGALGTATVELALGDVDPRRLVVIDGVRCLLDIRFRMLSNRELARAMGFDDADAEYEFHGTKSDVTRQIGNAVACGVAAALVGAILDDGVRTFERRSA